MPPTPLPTPRALHCRLSGDIIASLLQAIKSIRTVYTLCLAYREHRCQPQQQVAGARIAELRQLSKANLKPQHRSLVDDVTKGGNNRPSLIQNSSCMIVISLFEALASFYYTLLTPTRALATRSSKGFCAQYERTGSPKHLTNDDV